MIISIAGEQLELLPQKAVFLPRHQALLLADVHFGKVNHFRKAGIAVPQKANDKNTEGLIELLRQTRATRVIFLGDLFHSHYNEEWEVIGQLTSHFKDVSFELVLGNHDILGEHQYKRHGFHLHAQLALGHFLLTHEELTPVPAKYYNLSGHVHPGVRLHGKARQSLLLPCFYFGKRKGLLPAFGSFTGLAAVKPKEGDSVFAIIQSERVLKIK
ncbi:MAG: ligase-associated DNA damage response endonuclease PdeM [Cytophagales bacterium]